MMCMFIGPSIGVTYDLMQGAVMQLVMMVTLERFAI